MARRKPQTYLCPVCGWVGQASKQMTNQAWCPKCGTDLLDGRRKRKRRGGKAGREVVVKGEARE